MKLRTLMLAGATALLATPALAGQGWYIGFGAGWDHLNDPHITGLGIDGRLNTNDTAIVAATVGYKFPTIPFRLEAETAWDRHSTDGFDTGAATVSSSGHAEVRSFMINGLYDVHFLPRWKFSIGAGAGAGDSRVKFSLPVGIVHDRESTHFMWQGIAGFTYEATPNLDVFVDYHYRNLRNDNSDDDVTGRLVTHPLTEHVVMAGFRWYPWQEEAVYREPMAPPPPPPPPPAMPPAPVKTFIVFFDFNKSNLTAEAQSVVSEAVKTAQSGGAVRIMVTGHTDTVGSDTYNQALSLRRADAVKSQMVSDGLTADEIGTTGKSFHDPLVPTGPGVREPQNRRAVIDLGG